LRDALAKKVAGFVNSDEDALRLQQGFPWQERAQRSLRRQLTLDDAGDRQWLRLVKGYQKNSNR
jgi:hypothetical protein